MGIYSFLRKLLDEICGTYNLDRKAEKEFMKMRSLIKKGGKLNLLRAKRIENKLQLKYQLKIPCSAVIGQNFQIRHPQGIRIGRTAIIGDNCKVYPYFIAMAAVKDDDGRVGVRRHPKIGNDCILGSRASVIGPITIGDNVTIGACAIVTKDVPSHSVVKGTNQVRLKRLEEIPEKYKEEFLRLSEENNNPLK